MSTSDQIKAQHDKREQLRKEITETELALRRLIGRQIDETPGGLTAWARRLGISAPYASDLRHGHRRPSSELLEKILEESQ